MRRIAIINQKGGVGKTTTAVNLSAALAEAGMKVCLLDIDPQAHSSLHLGLALGENENSIYQCLIGEASLADARHQIEENLSVIPSHIDLAAAEMELAGEVGREFLLRELFEKDTEEFDYLIIDCPPSLGILTLNALTTAGEVFLPLQPHFLALHGFSKLLRTIEVVAKRLNPVLALTGVIFCMYEGSTRLAQEVIGDIEGFFENERAKDGTWSEVVNFETRIRRNVRLAEAPSYGKSIFQYAPNSHGAEDYRALAIEVLEQSTFLPPPPLELDSLPPRFQQEPNPRLV
ncbi:MAG: ParA family protein [Pirellulaceae bacterium]|nr:ParA family protein [Pirellulaceae bacterium]